MYTNELRMIFETIQKKTASDFIYVPSKHLFRVQEWKGDENGLTVVNVSQTANKTTKQHMTGQNATTESRNETYSASSAGRRSLGPFE